MSIVLFLLHVLILLKCCGKIFRFPSFFVLILFSVVFFALPSLPIDTAVKYFCFVLLQLMLKRDYLLPKNKATSCCPDSASHKYKEQF